METKDAIDKLIHELKKDSSYYYAWQSNIACAFMDELHTMGYKLPDQHVISNAAAKNFLNNLISSGENNE